MTQFEEVFVSELRPQIKANSFTRSPDGQHIAYAAVYSDPRVGLVMPWDDPIEKLKQFSAALTGQLCCVVDDVALEGYFPDIGQILFSPDSQRLAVAVLDGSRWRVILDGERQDAFDLIVPESLRFSPDSQRLGYVVEDRGHQLAVVDGEPGPPHTAVKGLIFSPNSQRVAYQCGDDDGDAMVIDDVIGRRFNSGVYDSIFSPDSVHIAYIGREEDDIVVMTDETASKPYTTVESMQFTPDNRLIYIGECIEGLDDFFHEHGQRYCLCEVVVDGKITRPEMGVTAPLTLMPDGQIAYLSGLPGQRHAVIGGQRTQNYQYAFPPVVVSPDGLRSAFLVFDDQALSVVVDGAKHPAFAGTGEGTLKFSSDSRHFTYDAQSLDSGRLVVLDGEPGPTWDTVMGGTPIFSPDGKKTAYVAQSGGESLIIENGIEGSERFEGVIADSLRYSQDSRLLIFAAGTSEGRFLSVGGARSEYFDNFCGPVCFPSPDVVSVLALRGQSVYLLTCRI